MAITVHRAAVIAALLAALTLSGCAAPSAYDSAWSECVKVNETVYPDGLEDARDGQVLDAEELCHSTVATQGTERFTELFNDDEWVQCYADALRGTGIQSACTPPASE